MNANRVAPWSPLFPAPTHAGEAVGLRFRLVRKHGEPLLLVPAKRTVVGEALSLYPAQTRKARAARLFLGVCLRAGFPLGTEPVVLRADPQALFARFLFPAATASKEFSFALLCGNPQVPGRRFILLVFDPLGQPRKLVKAGVGGQALELIRKETTFLKSLPAARLSAPAVLGEFTGDGLGAVALQYAAGKNPDPCEVSPLAKLLTSWLHTEQRMPFAELPAWRRLVEAAKSDPLLCRLEAAVAATEIRPAVFHGDLAPWNVRVDPATRRWVVLDWERGETAGPPGWDWFHFVIQTEILVRRARPERIASRVEALLYSAEFRAYAHEAGIGSIARPLVLAYLLYSLEVMPPAEGAGPTRELLNVLAERWQLG